MLYFYFLLFYLIGFCSHITVNMQIIGLDSYETRFNATFSKYDFTCSTKLNLQKLVQEFVVVPGVRADYNIITV